MILMNNIYQLLINKYINIYYMTSTKNHLYINGPINVIKLEGNIGQIKKTIQLFMYWDTSPDNQTKCDDIRAIDINTYFVRKFDSDLKSHPKRIYDFIYGRGPL